MYTISVQMPNEVNPSGKSNLYEHFSLVAVHVDCAKLIKLDHVFINLFTTLLM